MNNFGDGIRKKKGEGSVMGEDSLLERVTAAAEERQLSQNSLIAYRRIWAAVRIRVKNTQIDDSTTNCLGAVEIW